MQRNGVALHKRPSRNSGVARAGVASNIVAALNGIIVRCVNNVAQHGETTAAVAAMLRIKQRMAATSSAAA